jgi:hypothetical protein
LFWQKPAAGSYRLVWRSDLVCPACQESSREGLPAVRAELRDRLREPCRAWLMNAPEIDPSGWPVQPETLPLETGVELCLDAFFATPGRKFDFVSELELDRLPATHRAVLRKREPDPFEEQSFSSYEGSVSRTSDGRIILTWHFEFTVRP